MPLEHLSTNCLSETDRNGLGQLPMTLPLDHRGPAENLYLSLHPIITVSEIYQFGYKLSPCSGSMNAVKVFEHNENRLKIFLRSDARMKLYRKIYVSRD